MKELSENFPSMIEKGNNSYILQHKDDVAVALKRMAENDFAAFWNKHYFSLLIGVCDEYYDWISRYDAEKLKQEISIVRGIDEIGNIRGYVSYFSNATSYSLTANAYVSGYSVEYPKTPDQLICVLVHELCHGFMNDDLREEYKRLCENDEFLHKTHWCMRRNSFDEEEFVVAIEDYIALKNKIITKEQAKGQAITMAR